MATSTTPHGPEIARARLIRSLLYAEARLTYYRPPRGVRDDREHATQHLSSQHHRHDSWRRGRDPLAQNPAISPRTAARARSRLTSRILWKDLTPGGRIREPRLDQRQSFTDPTRPWRGHMSTSGSALDCSTVMVRMGRTTLAGNRRGFWRVRFRSGPYRHRWRGSRRSSRSRSDRRCERSSARPRRSSPSARAALARRTLLQRRDHFYGQLQLAEYRCIRRPWTHRVDANAVRCELERPRSRERLDGRLRRTIDRGARHRLVSGRAADVHDRALVRGQRRQRGLRHVHETEHVDLELRADHLLARRLERTDLEHRCVIDQYIQPPTCQWSSRSMHPSRTGSSGVPRL
jgi:hypothetical protein